jgi:thiol-disulfide isomerase/thioredoxin
LALWRFQTAEISVAEPPVEGFWSLQWDTPQGSRLAMESFRGRPLLINFWATWCTPCVEELPLINDFYRQNSGNGWQVLALAVDKLAPVQSFLQRMPLDFPVGMAGMTGTELGRSLGNMAGGLPFSVVLSAEGMIVQRKLGRLSAADLAIWLRLK